MTFSSNEVTIYIELSHLRIVTYEVHLLDDKNEIDIRWIFSSEEVVYIRCSLV